MCISWQGEVNKGVDPGGTGMSQYPMTVPSPLPSPLLSLDMCKQKSWNISKEIHGQ